MMHFMAVNLLPWTSACGIVYHSEHWISGHSAINSWDKVNCSECVEKLWDLGLVRVEPSGVMTEGEAFEQMISTKDGIWPSKRPAY